MAHSQMSQQELDELMNSVVYFDLDDLADSINMANQARASGQPKTIVLNAYTSAAAQQHARSQQNAAQQIHRSKKPCSGPKNQ